MSAAAIRPGACAIAADRGLAPVILDETIAAPGPRERDSLQGLVMWEPW